jgi:hypothetical protein
MGSIIVPQRRDLTKRRMHVHAAAMSCGALTPHASRSH